MASGRVACQWWLGVVFGDEAGSILSNPSIVAHYSATIVPMQNGVEDLEQDTNVDLCNILAYI